MLVKARIALESFIFRRYAITSAGFLTRITASEETGAMKAVNIKLSLAENVKTFVNIANRYPYDIDLRVGRHVVDGKSILGIFSLDLSKPITLEVYADHCDDLMEELKPFIIG